MKQPAFTDLKGLLEYTKGIGEQMFEQVCLSFPVCEIRDGEYADSPELVVDDMVIISFGYIDVETIVGTSTEPCFILDLLVHDPGGRWEPPSTDVKELMRARDAFAIWQRIIHDMVDDRLQNWAMAKEEIEAQEAAEEMYKQMEADLATNDPRNGG